MKNVELYALKDKLIGCIVEEQPCIYPYNSEGDDRVTSVELDGDNCLTIRYGNEYFSIAERSETQKLNSIWKEDWGYGLHATYCGGINIITDESKAFWIKNRGGNDKAG